MKFKIDQNLPIEAVDQATQIEIEQQDAPEPLNGEFALLYHLTDCQLS